MADAKKGEAAALAFGLTESLIKAFPELQEVFDLFVAEQYTKARLKYFQTNYYKNLIGASQDRTTKKQAQPGVYAQEYDAWKQDQLVRLNQKGIRVTPDIDGMLEDAYLKGYTNQQLDVYILNSGKLGTIGGTTLGAINKLKEYATDEGISQVLSDKYWRLQSEALLTGQITSDDIEEDLKNIAISAYPAYSKGIKEGRSFALQTSALRQTIANLLERDPDTITNDDPTFKQLVGYVNPKTQQQEIIPLWEAEKVIKSSEQWLYTKNARDTFDNLGLKVLRDWGLA